MKYRGACEHVTTRSLRCVMNEADCEPSHIDGTLNELTGERWRSAHYLDLQGKRSCTCHSTGIQACTTNGGDFTCVPQKEGYCDKAGYFYGELPLTQGFCRCDSHSFNKVQTRTKYGACFDTERDLHFCAYAPSDCEAEFDHVWVDPDDTKAQIGQDCYCEDVRTGGCIDSFPATNYVCAVTKDDCSGTYFAPHTLKTKHGQECRLCQSDRANEDEISDLDGPAGLSGGAIAGIVVGVLAGVSLLVASVIILPPIIRMKRRMADPPVETKFSDDSSVL